MVSNDAVTYKQLFCPETYKDGENNEHGWENVRQANLKITKDILHS